MQWRMWDLSIGRGELDWALDLKLHVLDHAVDHSKFLNPRVTWCYEYEDLMNSVVLAAKACMAGSPVYLVGLSREQRDVALLLVEEPVDPRHTIWAAINGDTTVRPLHPISWKPLTCVIREKINPPLEAS